ncbi:S9 family peptidase [Myxococcota bacterium]|nr:S9 family peptidase [Myxococcota bacterium]
MRGTWWNRVAGWGLPVLLPMVLALPGRAETGKAPDIDDVMRLPVVSDFEVAPGGREVVFRLQRYDGGPRFLRDLWVFREGQGARPLTRGGRTGGSFTLSPDGKQVAFAGEREGKQGIFLLPLDGGEAGRVLESPIPLDNLRFVGDFLYFSASVEPDCGGDFGCTVERQKARRDQTSAMVYDRLYVRPWNQWADGTRIGLFRVRASGGPVEVVVLDAGWDALPLPFGGREDYDVSRDGAILHTAKKVPDPWKSTNTDLFLVENGQARRITDNPAADRAPRFSPDGKRIAWLAQAVPGFESDRWRLRVMDRQSGKSFTVADEIDDWVEEFAWTPDGREIVFSVMEKGRLPLYRVEAKPGARARPVTGPATCHHPTVEGNRLFFTRDSMLRPAELHLRDLRSGGTSAGQALTDFGAEELKRLSLPSVEEVWWDGAVDPATGRPARVHGFLVVPQKPAAPGPRPVVMFIHGGPQGAFLDSFHPRWNPLALASLGYAIVLPNPTGSVGYGQAFVNAVSRDWGGRPYEDLMRLLDHLQATRPDLDLGRVCAMGGSYGGYMANWMEARSGKRFRCLVSHAGPSFLEVKYGTTDELWFPEWDIGGTPWDHPEEYRKVSPSSYVREFQTPMLILHGANDFRVPLEQALFLFTALQSRGVESRLVVFPDEDHFIQKPANRRFWYRTVGDWLSRHLQ